MAELALVKDQWSLDVLSWQSPCLACMMLWVPSPARYKSQHSDVHLCDLSIGEMEAGG